MKEIRNRSLKYLVLVLHTSKRLMHLIILVKNAIKRAQQERYTATFVSTSAAVVGGCLSGMAELKPRPHTFQHEVSCYEKILSA